MAAGGFCKLPNGTVVVALNLPSPADGAAGVRVLVHAQNRARALTRLPPGQADGLNAAMRALIDCAQSDGVRTSGGESHDHDVKL